MISCTEFIPAYSAYFSFLHDLDGKEAVVRFWEHLSDTYLTNLRDLAQEKGLRGLYEYWSAALNEEAADFVMTLDEEEGVFQIDMRHCPSKGRLLQLTQMEPYADYCEHCDVLYRRVLEPLGYEYDIDLSRTDRAQGTITVRKGTAPH